MKTEDFELLSGLVKERSGLVLSEDKLYLIESRLIPLARRRGLAGLDDLVSAIRSKGDEPLLVEITEAMTTNESSFFRDSRPFEIFRNFVLPKILESRAAKRSFRIWSAACSTGQEPYSLAMCLREEADRLKGWRTEIIATDLSNEVLEKAKVGMYSQFEAQRGLPIEMLMKYFAQANDRWQVDASIRAMVQFRQCNLLHDISAFGPADIVLCRNVLIYFDPATKRAVLEKMHRLMPPDGFLFLGGAETVLGVTKLFQPINGQRGVYELAPETSH